LPPNSWTLEAKYGTKARSGAEPVGDSGKFACVLPPTDGTPILNPAAIGQALQNGVSAGGA